MTEYLDRLIDNIIKPLYDENSYRGIVTSILASLGKEKLNEIETLCKKTSRYRILLCCIKDAKTPKKKRIFKLNQFIEYKRNESISQLLKWFEDPHSGKKVYARTELKHRFITQSRKDQIRIIKSMLVSTSMADREWAAIWADRDWSPAYCENLKRALEIKPSRSIAITAVHHLPIAFLKENEDVLRGPAALHLCIRLGHNPHFDLSRYGLDIFEYLYATASVGRKIDEYDIDVEQKVFTYIFEFIRNDGYKKCLYPIGIFTIPLFNNVIWALGVHGMTETLFSLLDCINYVFQENVYLDWCGQFDRALSWINREWEIEDERRVVEDSDSRINTESSIGEIISALRPDCNKILSDLGLIPVSYMGNQKDDDFSENFIDKNPFG